MYNLYDFRITGRNKEMTLKLSISKNGMKSLAKRHQEHDWANLKECSLHNSTMQEHQGLSVLFFYFEIFSYEWFKKLKNFYS